MRETDPRCNMGRMSLVQRLKASGGHWAQCPPLNRGGSIKIFGPVRRPRSGHRFETNIVLSL